MIQDFGELVLIIGDFNQSFGAASIPYEFDKLLNTNKINHVLCTGNVGNNALYERIKSINPTNFHIVRGDYDFFLDEASHLPDYKVVKIGDYVIGLIHGHQILPWGSLEALIPWQRKLDCDILVSGFSHQNAADKIEGHYFLNPGSATGAFNPRSLQSNQLIIPSFMLMSIMDSHVTLYVYELKDNEAKVTMSEFSKDDN